MKIILFHGSRKNFPIGFRLLPQKDGYTSYQEVQNIENLFEKYKPENKTSRKLSVFLTDNVNKIDEAGGYTDYIYAVKPESTPEASDLAWYSEADSLYDEEESPSKELLNAIAMYWNGTPYHDSSKSNFEYRCKSSLIIKALS